MSEGERGESERERERESERMRGRAWDSVDMAFVPAADTDGAVSVTGSAAAGAGAGAGDCTGATLACLLLTSSVGTELKLSGFKATCCPLVRTMTCYDGVPENQMVRTAGLA